MYFILGMVTCSLLLAQFHLIVFKSHLVAASVFALDFTTISAGFDAIRGDTLGCCDVRIPFRSHTNLHFHHIFI